MLEFDANSWHIFRLLIAMEVLISASCVCRCLARWRKRLPLSWDDGWIFLAWALYTTYFALCLASLHKGQAQVYTTPLPREDIITINKLNYAGALMFEMANIASKFSILCLYRRIFATANFRRWTLLVFALCICWFLSSILVTIFYCIPVSDYWNPTTATPRCIDTYKFIMGYEIGNMLCDIAILALPLRMVALLQLDIAQKTMLSGVFLLGGFVCITSVLRIYYTNSGTNIDKVINTIIWSDVSVAMSILCANLPTLAPFVPRQKAWQRFSRWTTHSLLSLFGSRSQKSDSAGSANDGSRRARRSRYHDEDMGVGGYGRLDGNSIERHDVTITGRQETGDQGRKDTSAYPLQGIRVQETFDVN